MHSALRSLRVGWRRLSFRPWTAAVELGEVHVEGRIWLPGSGKVRIGDGVRLLARRAAIELRAHSGAEIVIADDVLIEDGTSIEATSSVRIGERARIGAFCKIIDNHFHRPGQGDRFERPTPVPVVIGPDALIGPHAVLLPGAEVGAGAAVGAGAVLSFRLAPGAVFLGTTSAMPTQP
jgi:acetyltransferase-like isoleucine patch superfamily enzyme